MLAAFMETGSYFMNQTSSVNTTQPSTYQFTLDLLLAIPSVAQLLLCGIVLLIFCRVPSLRTASSLPIVNLVASDFVRAILGFLAIPVFIESRTVTPSTADNILCVAFRYMNNVQFAWSSWAIAIIAYGRYDVIVNVFAPKFDQRRFWGSAVISWLASLLTALPPLIGWSSFGFERKKNSYVCSTGPDTKGLLHAVYLPFFYIVNFLLPTVLVILFFSRVFWHAKCLLGAENSLINSKHRINSLPVFRKSSGLRTEQQQRRQIARQKTKEIIRCKAFRYVVAIVTSNLLLLAPFAAVRCYGTVCSELGLDLRVPRIAYQITAVLFTLNFNINSFLYVFWIKTFEQGAIALFSSCCGRRQTNNLRQNM